MGFYFQIHENSVAGPRRAMLRPNGGIGHASANPGFPNRPLLEVNLHSGYMNLSVVCKMPSIRKPGYAANASMKLHPVFSKRTTHKHTFIRRSVCFESQTGAVSRRIPPARPCELAKCLCKLTTWLACRVRELNAP